MVEIVIVGIDPSSRKIAATITVDDGAPEIRVHALPPGRPVEACLIAFVRVRAMIKEFVGPEREVYVFIEEPVYVRGKGGANAVIPQSRTNGAMLAGASSVNGVHVQGVNNLRCKKQVVGIGNASKDQVKAWCYKHWPAAYDLADGDQDVLDSAMINRYGQKMIELKGHIVVPRKRNRILKRR